MLRLIAILALCLTTFTIHSQSNCTLSSFAYDVKHDGDQFYLAFSQPLDLEDKYVVYLNQEVQVGDSLVYGPFKADCETFYSFVVVHKENESCNVQANLGTICNQNTTCRLGEVEFSYPECNPNGIVYVDMNFKYQNASDSFAVNGNGTNYGTFAYLDLPVSIGPIQGNCEKELNFHVQDNIYEDCTTSLSSIVICCPINCDEPVFKISEMDCSEDLLFMVLEMADSFELTNILVKVDETYIQDYELDFPYIHFTTNIKRDSARHLVSVCSVGIADVWCYSQEFRTDDCTTNDDCKIYNVSYAIPACDDNEEVYIEVDFKHKNVTSDSFQVQGNGVKYGKYAYEDLPVKIGPFAPTCDLPYELVIFDSEQDGCFAAINSIAICCNSGCVEPIFEVISTACSDEAIKIKVALGNELLSDSFTILLNEKPVESYELQFPYLYIKGEIANDLVHELTICSESFSALECCYSQLIEIPCLDTTECVISGIQVSPADCIDAGLPGFYIDFEYAQIGSKGFTLKGNGNYYGDFKYENLPIYISVSDDCEKLYEFIVIDNEKGCSNFVEFGQFCCSNNCSFKIRDERITCEEGVLTEVAFLIEEDTDPVINYKVYIDGLLIGETSDNNTFLEFETDIDLDTTGQISLTICDDVCCVTRTLSVSDCIGEQENCEISNVRTIDVGCGEEGLSFIIDFDHEGTKSGEFELFSVFGKFGTYKYSDLPLEIEGYPFVNIGLNILFICDKGSFCCQAHLFPTPFCLNSYEKHVAFADEKKSDHTFIRQNPVSKEVVLDSPFSETSYQIMDSSGKLVLTFTAEQLRTRKDVSDLKSGLYLVRIQYQGKIKIEKLIITN